jgi:hypothetical protein
LVVEGGSGRRGRGLVTVMLLLGLLGLLCLVLLGACSNLNFLF